MAKANCNEVPKANIVNSEHKTELVENLWKCLAERELLDLVFICDKNIKVFAHKLVFATVSQFLYKIINVNIQDVVYVSIPDVDHNRLKMLVKFLYEGEASVTYEEMMYLRELMVLLDIDIKNSEIKPIEPFTPICMRDIEEKDPLTAERSMKVRPQSIVPKVESNTDYFSNEAHIKDLVCSAGNVKMLTGDTVNTDLLKKETEDTKDNDDLEVISIDTEEEENEVIDLSSNDDDSDVVECAVMETAPCRAQENVRMVPREESSKQLNIKFHDKGISREHRTTFSEQQKLELENAYIKNKLPGSATISNIANTLGVSRKSVLIWFGNRRRKDKRVWNRPYNLTSNQKEILNAAYMKEKYPTKDALRTLEKSLGLPILKIQMWFASKRIRDSSGGNRLGSMTSNQKEILNAAYMKEKYPSKDALRTVEKNLGLPVSKIQMWFASKRQKDSSVCEEGKNRQIESRSDIMDRNAEDTQVSRDMCEINDSSRTVCEEGKNSQIESRNDIVVESAEDTQDSRDTCEINDSSRTEVLYPPLLMSVDEEEDDEVETMKNCQDTENDSLKKMMPTINKSVPVSEEGKNKLIKLRSDIVDGNAEDTQDSKDSCELNGSSRSAVVYSPLLMSVDEEDDEVETAEKLSKN